MSRDHLGLHNDFGSRSGELGNLIFEVVQMRLFGGKMPIDETVNSYSCLAPSLYNWTSLASQDGLRYSKCDLVHTSTLVHRGVELAARTSKGLSS